MLALGFTLFVPHAGHAAAPPAQCNRVVIHGDLDAGHEWRQPFGQGWMFRLMPIKPGTSAYSGWDLVVDRAVGAGFPDALLLATPPYDSINQREVGTTFGLRAQDAIGWNPRSFHFLTNPAALRKAQKLYFALHGSGNAARQAKAAKQLPDGSPLQDSQSDAESTAGARLMEMTAHASAGQFRILEARLTPGTGDPLPYARNWAIQARNTPHVLTPSPVATPAGRLDWIRFEITLWLPADWKVPKVLKPALSPCD